MIMFLFHRIELMHSIRQARPVHAMYKQVPTFQAMVWILKFSSPTIHTLQLTFKMPVHRNNTHNGANKRKCGIHLVGRWLHCSF